MKLADIHVASNKSEVMPCHESQNLDTWNNRVT